MRADRLLSIVLLLQSRQQMTAPQLAEHLEVSERTIYRDMDALSAAGIPVVAERGRGGGWSLLEGYRTTLTRLNANELQALVLNNPARVLDDLGLGQAADAAFLKLLASLPQMLRRDVEYFRQRILIDTGRWHGLGDATPCLSALQEALWQDAQIDMTYRRSDGKTVERVVNPLGLVAKGPIWYLVALVDEDIRTYRVSRVQTVRLNGARCQRPPAFDLAAYWQESTRRFIANLPRYPVTLRLDESALPKLHAWRYSHVQSVSEPDTDGWVMAQVDFEILDEACERVLSLGERAVVVQPDELRQRVIERAAGILAVYGGGE